jgi:hypothetical protein
MITITSVGSSIVLCEPKAGLPKNWCKQPQKTKKQKITYKTNNNVGQQNFISNGFDCINDGQNNCLLYI